MKKFSILTGMFLLFLQAANAQNQKGDQTLGVSLGFSAISGSFNYEGAAPGTLDNGSTQGTSFSTNPGYSYFIANHLDIGASIGFGNDTYSVNDHTSNLLTKEVQKNYYGSIYLRKYLLYNNKIGIRTGPYLAYQYFNSNIINTPDTNQQNSNYSGKNYHAGIIADFVYYPSSKIGLAVNLGSLAYNYGKTASQEQGTSNGGINLQFLNNNLMLSAFYVFGN